MGVKDLWKLLETTGRPVTLESLEGLVLAVGEDNVNVQYVHVNQLFTVYGSTHIFNMYVHPLTLYLLNSIYIWSYCNR